MKNRIKSCARCKAHDNISCMLGNELEVIKAKEHWQGWKLCTTIHKPKSGTCQKPLTFSELDKYYERNKI